MSITYLLSPLSSGSSSRVKNSACGRGILVWASGVASGREVSWVSSGKFQGPWLQHSS